MDPRPVRVIALPDARYAGWGFDNARYRRCTICEVGNVEYWCSQRCGRNYCDRCDIGGSGCVICIEETCGGP